jgi:predicted protein tyrosine phosphatase
MNVLFICSRNQWRSPTAARVFAHRDSWQVRAAGLSSKSPRVVSRSDLEWADLVFVMEHEHHSRLRDRFGRIDVPLHVLEIPDDYQFMAPELVDLLVERVDDYLAVTKPHGEGTSAMQILTRDGQPLRTVSVEVEGALNFVDLDSADLSDAALSNLTMQGINLSSAKLCGADLRGADMYAAMCFDTDFSGADLRGACLRGAVLTGANLSGADIRQADLSSDNTGHRTTLDRANLSTARLDGATFTGATYDDATRFPPHFDPVLSGMVHV